MDQINTDAPAFAMAIDPHATVKNLGHDSVAAYQQFWGLTADGIAGPVTLTHISQRFCMLPDFMNGAQTATWPERCRRITIAHRLGGQLPGIDSATINRMIDTANEMWERTGGIQLPRVDDFEAAMVRAAAERLPGPTLAYAFLADGTCDKKRMAYDSLTTWSANFFGIVWLHEVGHILGLEHSNDTRDVMYPSADPRRRLDEYPGPGDLRRILAGYGPPAVPAPPAPPPGDDLAIRWANDLAQFSLDWAQRNAPGAAPGGSVLFPMV